jgi:regulator of sirC expression with transglutaminase-like and TPR domain
MDPAERFAHLLRLPDADLPLDEMALVIAAHARPALDVGAYLGRLDDLAASCPAPTLDSLLTHLFVRGPFRGNQANYYDPANSLLDQVIDRGLGIPITLSAVAMEVGRRLGVPLWGVGMPGHFLLRDKVDPTVFADPFHGGRQLDAAGCQRLFTAMQGEQAAWRDEYLEPVSRREIVIRMLNNLKLVFERSRDLARLRWVMRLRCAIPEIAEQEQASFRVVMAPWN